MDIFKVFGLLEVLFVFFAKSNQGFGKRKIYVRVRSKVFDLIGIDIYLIDLRILDLEIRFELLKKRIGDSIDLPQLLHNYIS